MKQPVDTDYPLSEVPAGARKGLWSTSILLFGFTFFTATMFAGGKIGLAFDFKTMLWAAVIGNLLLGLYAAALGLIACRSGLSSVLMGRFCFGEVGSRLSDVLLGFTDFADFVLENRMAKDGAAARAFVAELEAKTRPYFEQESAALLAFALQFWDFGVWQLPLFSLIASICDL